jgi:hypothetical protein
MTYWLTIQHLMCPVVRIELIIQVVHHHEMEIVYCQEKRRPVNSKCLVQDLIDEVCPRMYI